MNSIFCGMLFIGCNFGFVLSTDLNGRTGTRSECDAICGLKDVQLGLDKNCDCLSFVNNDDLTYHVPKTQISKASSRNENDKIPKGARIVKRDTLEDVLKKVKTNRNSIKALKLLPVPNNPKRNLFQKKPIKNVKATELPSKQLRTYQDLQDRLKKFKSKKPQLRTRSNFNAMERPNNIIQELRSRQDDIKEQIRKSSSKSNSKNIILRANHVDFPKMESLTKKPSIENGLKKIELTSSTPITTAASKMEQASVIVLMSSTTAKSQLAPKVEDKTKGTEDNINKNGETVSSAIEKIKEKQKEVVMKIKDKILSANKPKPNDKENSPEKDNST